jgi:hypothetical protein
MITKTTDPDRDLTIYTCEGIILAKDVLQAIDEFYQGTITRNVLWDLLEADLNQVSSKEVQLIATRVAEHAPDKKGGRTAIVAFKTLALGLSRMYEIRTEMSNPAPMAQTQVFQTLKEAFAWFDDNA